MRDKISIVFVIPSLVPGGAERVMSFVSQNINSQIFNSTLVVAGFEKDTSYDVSSVNVIYLNKSRILYAIPPLIYFFIKEKPNIVLSSIGHLNSAIGLIASFFPKVKFIGREATIPSKRKNEKPIRKYSPYHLFKSGSRNLDIMICQSDDMVNEMELNAKFPRNKLVKINNPISSIGSLKKTIKPNSHKKFITVGRLTEVKGHLRILGILSRLKQPFEYTLVGEGSKEYKETIFNKAKELGIYKHIRHIPFTQEVNKYLIEHDMFLQGSFVEGFPNAVLESCVAGTPVIAFDVPGGTKEIIEHNVNGFLVKNHDEESYLNYLKQKKEWEPKKVRESVYKKFNKEKIIKDYENLFLNVLKN